MMDNADYVRCQDLVQDTRFSGPHTLIYDGPDDEEWEGLALEKEGAGIPQRFTCDGEDISPALSWGDPPTGTASLALLMHDPDAPSRTFTHWILYNLPADLRSLNEDSTNQPVLGAVRDAKQGRNDFGNVGYRGPCILWAHASNRCAERRISYPKPWRDWRLDHGNVYRCGGGLGDVSGTDS